MNNPFVRRIVQNAISSRSATLTIGGNRHSLAELEAMTEAERVTAFGQWAAEYVSRFIDACHSTAEYPVLYDPDDGEPVAIEARIPGRQIIRVTYTRTNPNAPDAA